MPPRTYYTDADRARVRELAADHTKAEVARITGISRNALGKWEKRYDIPFKAFHSKHGEGMRERARVLAQDCRSWRELARRTGVSQTALHEWGQRDGWRPAGSKTRNCGPRSQQLSGEATIGDRVCLTCEHRDRCSDQQCACEVGELPPPESLPDVVFRWEMHQVWWESWEPSALVRAARMCV